MARPSIASSSASSSFPQRLDRAALAAIFVLLVLVGGLLLSGFRGKPQVRSFNWDGRQVGAVDTAMTLGFNRPMDAASVEKNLQFFTQDKDGVKSTLIPGRPSWSGRRLFYTLDRPLAYGQTFRVKLEGGQDRFRVGDYHEKMQTFEASFKSRDRSFAYIGAEGDEAGRLVMFNMTQNQKLILTPSSLQVFDFKPYPLGDRILFSATAKQANTPPSLVEQELYSVTTGVQIRTPNDDVPVSANSGQITKVLDNRDYQLLKFDLAPNGEVAVVQRVSRKDSTRAAPWIVRLTTDQPPEALKFDKPTGEFLITPDSEALVVALGQGLSVVDLKPKDDKTPPLAFLPKFGNVLGMSADGSLAAMLKFNSDYTRSLYLVNNQGNEKEIVKTLGSILKAQFSANRQSLFCLLTELIEGAQYKEQAYIAAIDLKAIQSGKEPKTALYPLLKLPDQREVNMSLSPDNLAILIDQKVAAVTTDGKPTQTSQLWIVPLGEDFSKPIAPVDLTFAGSVPRWMP
jgi:hypothetical protein